MALSSIEKEIKREIRREIKSTKGTSKNELPFSKNTVLSARYESYVIAVIVIIMACVGIDVTAISILLTLSWGGYRILQNYYINMAKHEHIYEMKLRYKQAGLSDDNLDIIQDELENEDLESEVL